jgi:hypothetical protein
MRNIESVYRPPQEVPMTLQDEIAAVRHGLDEVERAMRPLRERSAASRLVTRLDGDLRRAHEDLDDLAAEAGPATAHPVQDFEPVLVPPRTSEPDYDPDCDDEGLSGSRLDAQSSAASGARAPRRGLRRHV